MSRPTLIFGTTTSLLSRIIRFVTGGTVSHVGVGGLELEGIPVVLHADVGGVQISPRATFLAQHGLVAEYEIAATIDLPYAVAALGEKYDYVGLVGYLVVIIGRWCGKKLRNPFASPRETVCSEFVFALDKEKTVDEWSGLLPSSTTPEDLLEIASLHAEHFVPIFPPPILHG